MKDSGNFQKHTEGKELANALEKGEYFQGVIRMNAQNRHRAFVHVKEFPIDVMLDG